MYCMKCGKETSEDKIFCDSCLAVMDRYPIKHSIKIQLPNRAELAPVKKPLLKKKEPTPEERIEQLQKIIKTLILSLAAVVLVLILSIALLVDALSTEDNRASIGQNYSTVENLPSQ